MDFGFRGITDLGALVWKYSFRCTLDLQVLKPQLGIRFRAGWCVPRSHWQCGCGRDHQAEMGRKDKELAMPRGSLIFGNHAEEADGVKISEVQGETGGGVSGKPRRNWPNVSHAPKRPSKRKTEK